MSDARSTWEAWMRIATRYARRNPGARFRIYGIRYPHGWSYMVERIKK